MKHFVAPGVEASRSAIGTRSAPRWMKPRRVSRVDGVIVGLRKLPKLFHSIGWKPKFCPWPCNITWICGLRGCSTI